MAMLLSLATAEVRSYCGRRQGRAQVPFEVVFIETETNVLRIFFTVPLDPRTVSAQSILINGETLPEGSSIRFNRPGRLIECVLAEALAEEAVISLADIRSFNGMALKNAEISGIRQNMRWFRRAPHGKKQDWSKD